jgi:hypothetical protein
MDESYRVVVLSFLTSLRYHTRSDCPEEGGEAKCEDHDVSDGGADSRKACCDTAGCGVFYFDHGKPEEGGQCMVSADHASATDACLDVPDIDPCEHASCPRPPGAVKRP